MSWDPRNPNHCPCCDSREPCVHQGATRPAHIAWREGRRAAEDYLQGAAPTPAGLEHEAPVSPYAETDDEHVWWSRAFSARTAQIRFARTFEWIGPEVPPDIEAAINRLIAKAHARGVASARLDQTATASVDYQRCGDETAIAEVGQALVDAWDKANGGPPHRFAVYTDPEGDEEVARGWMAMARMHASALAAAREAGRREVLEGAAGVEEAIDAYVSAIERDYRGELTLAGVVADPIRVAVAAIAADKARAVEGLRPVLSREDAERLVGAFYDEMNVWHPDGHGRPARAALLAALTGAGGGR